MINRRNFLQILGAGGLSMSAGAWLNTAHAAAKVPTNVALTGRIVIVGGGMAGATAAKYLRLWGGTGLQVTLVEREAKYTSNILSNLVLTGARTLSSLEYTYAKLVSNYGIKVIQGDVLGVDPISKKVSLAGGGQLAYDRLILAPGIEFDPVRGLGPMAAKALAPHAWKAGPQTTLLRKQIAAMPAGGVYVMSIPAKPYRCPPGPYERACVVADYLKRVKPGSKVVVLDANPGIVAETRTFTNAFDVVHKGVVEYHPGVVINRVDTSTMTVNTSIGNIKGKVLNIIPSHRAGKIITQTGLANDNEGRWAKVNVLSYESTAVSGIHIIGDSSATTQPKAGHIANQEAKVCADAIVRLMQGGKPDPAPVTNSACYSPITSNTASFLTVVFAYDPITKTMQAVPASAGEAETRSKDNYEEMMQWFNTLMEETFS